MTFRKDPVPGTGRFHWHYFRKLRYGGRLLREHQSIEGDPEFRGKRRSKNLPSAWDELPKAAMEDRSWKRFRRTQSRR